VANAALVFLLIPYLGLVGAALGTAVSFLGAFIVLMVMSQRAYPVPHQWYRLAAAFAVSIAAVVAQRVLLRVVPGAENAQAFLIEVAVFVAVGAAISLLLLDRRELAMVVGRVRLILWPKSNDGKGPATAPAGGLGAAVLPGHDSELKRDE
jgi:O-antigen/teichoic acid export membrane protein